MLELQDLSVNLGGAEIVRSVSLEVSPGETVALLGPSGAGKSTLLRAIAGLVPIAEGTVSWNGERMNEMPPHNRNFGFMFQDYALFPHRNVAGNVGFGLEMRGVDRSEIAETVSTSLDWVGMPNTQARSVESLSGGEQQRVALARALAPHPELLMLDEPVGSLDRELRARLTSELADLLRDRDLTAIVVTHDQAEAFAIANRVAVMRDGELVGFDTPEALWQNPPDEWTARFLGMSNIVDHAELGRVLIRPEAIAIGDGAYQATIHTVVFGEGTYRIEAVTDAGWELAFSSFQRTELGESVSLSIATDGIVPLT